MNNWISIFLTFGWLIGNISLNKIEVKEGHPLNISCPITTEDHFIWIDAHNNRIQENNENNRIYAKTDDNEMLLIFKFVLVKDMGDYHCCNFKNSTDRIKFSLLVIGPPMFEQDYESHELFEGANITLICQAYGYPYPTYQWLDNLYKKIASKGENWKVSNGKLIISSIKNSQEGLYTCQADNKYGNKSKLYLIDIVEDKQSWVELDIKQKLVTPVSVQFDIRLKPNQNISFTYIFARFTQKNLYKPTDLFWAIEPYLIDKLKPNATYEVKFGVAKEKNLESVIWDKHMHTVQTPINNPNLIVKSISSSQVKIEWPYRSFDDVSGPKAADFFLITYTKLQTKAGAWFLSECSMNITIPACHGRWYIISGLSPNQYYLIELKVHYPYGWTDTVDVMVYTENLLNY